MSVYRSASSKDASPRVSTPEYSLPWHGQACAGLAPCRGCQRNLQGEDACVRGLKVSLKCWVYTRLAAAAAAAASRLPQRSRLRHMTSGLVVM